MLVVCVGIFVKKRLFHVESMKTNPMTSCGERVYMVIRADIELRYILLADVIIKRKSSVEKKG
ncbi:hypothetical protein DRN72_01445 [Methanosarcinales archaeon]|nr:MAG: hypothetical protein DRN72_01445 [Methanosarcinales archaeon]